MNPFYVVSKIPSTPNTPNTPRTPGAQPESESPGSKKKDHTNGGTRRRATRTKSKTMPPLNESEALANEPTQNYTVTDGPTENILCLACAYTFTKKSGKFCFVELVLFHWLYHNF